MLSTIHLFCDLGAGYTQYLDDDTKPLFKSFVSQSKAKSQMMIHRNESVVYYAYIRRLSNGKSPDKFFGACVSNNGSMITDYRRLFEIFEQTVSLVASQGVILQFDTNGELSSKADKLYNYKGELSQVADYLKSQVDRIDPSFIKPLPPVDYSINCTEPKIFPYEESIDNISKYIANYPFVYILKDKNFISDNEHSFRNIIKGKNKNISDLQAANEKLKKDYQKLEQIQKRTRLVVWLVIVVIVVGAGLAYFGYKTSERGEIISRLNVKLENTKDSLKTTRITLNKKSQELGNVYYRLGVSEDSVKRCRDRINTINSELSDARLENYELSEINRKLNEQLSNASGINVTSVAAGYDRISFSCNSSKYYSNVQFVLKIIKYDGQYSRDYSFSKTINRGSNNIYFYYPCSLANGVYHFVLYCEGKVVAYHKW